MKKRYQAAFIVPIGASKVLGEDGWEFKSSKRLSKQLGEYLVEVLNLEFVEAYSGIRRYAGDHIKMSIVFDGYNEVESIYFQIFDGSLTVLSEVCKVDGSFSEAEIFIPSKR
ncbi:hypothetical protein [Pseudomonas lini]